MFPGQAGLNVAVSLEKNAGYYLGDSSKFTLFREIHTEKIFSEHSINLINRSEDFSLMLIFSYSH